MPRPSFRQISKGLLLCLGVVFLWSLWVQAQPTNPPPTAPVLGPFLPGKPAGANTTLSFGLDRLPVLHRALFAGIPLWQILASLVYTGLAFAGVWLLDWAIIGRLKKLARRTATRFDDLALSLLRRPVRIVLFVILLHVGMRVYTWPGFLIDFFAKALHVTVAVSITWVLLRATDVVMSNWRERTTTAENEQFSRDLLPLIGRSMKVFVLIVAVLVTSQNLGLNVTGLIASLSIGGIALGLAAQDTLGNLFGAVAVLVDKPFRVGDRIQLAGIDGTVESIGFRSTRVRSPDGHLVTIPNKTVGNATITNIARRPGIRTVMNLGITYDTPPAKIREAVAILETAFRGHPQTSDVVVAFDKFGDSALNLQVTHWWNGTVNKDCLLGLQEINLVIKERFDAAGIEFAFPTQTLHVRPPAAAPAGTVTDGA